MDLQQNLTIVVFCSDGQEHEIELSAQKPYRDLSNAQHFIARMRQHTLKEEALIGMGSLELAFLTTTCLIEYLNSQSGHYLLLPEWKKVIDITNIIAPTGEFGLEAQIWLAHEMKRPTYWGY